MKKLALFLLAVVGSIHMYGAQAATPTQPHAAPTPQPVAAAAAPKPIAQIAWLVGGVWTADATKMGGGMQRIETRYRWSDNGSFIRFTTHFVTDKAVLKTYDGNFFWNAAQQTLSLWYMDTKEAVTEGPVKWEGDRMQVLFSGVDFDGQKADLRVELVRENDDHYRWELSEKQTGGWKPLATLPSVRRVRAVILCMSLPLPREAKPAVAGAAGNGKSRGAPAGEWKAHDVGLGPVAA